MITLSRSLVSTVALATALAAAPAFAQAAPGPAPAASTQAPADIAQSTAPSQPGVTAPQAPSIDDIVVTAQKRTQNLQDVPIVVTTVNRQLLQDSGVKDIKDLATLAPGLLVTSTSSEASTTARIRGIGTVGDNPGLESSVGVVIDGVYRPRNGVSFGDIGDIDRIEVLKGPQGTLFGKSATAGVINIITALPSFTPHADAEFEVSNYHGIGGSGEITGGLTDTIAASFYVAARQRDGFFSVNTGNGPRTDNFDTHRNVYTFRGQLLFKPTDDFTLRLIGDYSHRDEDCCIAVIVRPSQAPVPNLANGTVAALGGSDGNPVQPYARRAFANRPDDQVVNDRGGSAQADWKVGPGTLTSITAYRVWKNTGGFDADFSTADLDYLPDDDSNSTQFKTFSQELRYGGTSKVLDYLVGGFYSNEKLRQNTALFVGTQFTPYLSLALSPLVEQRADPTFLNTFATFPLVGGVRYGANTGGVDRYRQTDDTYAAFTNDTLHLARGLDLNLGARYTIDVKDLNTTSFNVGGGAGCAAANTAFGYLNGAAPATAQALAAVNETLCLPFLSPGFNNFTDQQHEAEHNLSGTAKLAYRFSPQLLTYASYARGYKAGGFNLDREQCTVGQPGCTPGSAAVITPITQTGFRQETNNSYEVGEKATLLNRKLLFNVTGFYQEYRDFQLNTFTGLVFVVDSIPKVTSKGVDVDTVWFATPSLRFQGGFTYADTRYDLTPAQLADFQLKTGYQGTQHSQVSLAPLWSASLSGTYTASLDEHSMARFNLGAKYSSDYNTGSDLDPGKIQKAYTIVDMRIAFGPKSGRWAFEIWSENLLDTNYKQVTFDSGFQNIPNNETGVLDAFLGAPRTMGATVRLHL